MTRVGMWLAQEAKQQVEAAVVQAEAKTSAEFVVTVRVSSGSYRAADLWFASLVTFAGLLIYVYHPTEFTDDLVPPALFLLFLLSGAFASQLSLLRRLLTPTSVLEENTRRAAHVEFHAQGIGATQGRTGILVYVSLLERSVAVVPDIGVDIAALGGDGETALATLRTAAKAGGLEALVAGLAQLSDALSRTLPRADDDVNELPDSVVS